MSFGAIVLFLFSILFAVAVTGAEWAIWPMRKFWKEQRRRWEQ
jgi:hypothetical protein